MDLGNVRKLTEEETAELYAVREATLPQLVILANKSGEEAKIMYNSDGIGYVVLTDYPDMPMYEPRYHPEQNHALLEAVIKEGDCRLFYDDGVHEFFIYQYRIEEKDGLVGNSDGPPLAYNRTLSDTVFAAAMELWFPGDEAE